MADNKLRSFVYASKAEASEQRVLPVLSWLHRFVKGKGKEKVAATFRAEATPSTASSSLSMPILMSESSSAFVVAPGQPGYSGCCGDRGH